MVRSDRLRVCAFGMLAACFVFAAPGCAKRVQKVELPSGPATIDELWQAPAADRNLFHGPGGADLAPRDKSFAMITKDETGFSPGYDVRDSAGVEWSVKLGPEAQTEVVTSRVLWGIGFHQPATYYMNAWTLTGAESGAQQPGRFRPTVAGHKVVGDWSWYENPFVGTREFGGLVVANLILNNWDWKTSNNTIYALAEPVNGVRRWFVVRDVGASLGKTSYPTILKWVRLRGFGQGSRNDLPGFEAQGFIKSVSDDGRVEFDYRGIYKDVINSVTVADVRWACELMSKLTDAQWADAFRAGGFTDEQNARYVRKIKEKIAQGLALPVK
jgi:hypothetical protein